MGGRGAAGGRRRKTDSEIANEIAAEAGPPPTEQDRQARVAARWDRAVEKTIADLTADLPSWDTERFTTMTELRKALDRAGTGREEQDRQLTRMVKEHKLFAIPQSNRRLLEQADHDAALRIGGEDNHRILWRAPHRRPGGDAASSPE